MEYLADRVKKLIEAAAVIDWDDKHRLFINGMIEVLEDCAVITDDIVDALDEFDMRLSELEERISNGDGPE